MDIIMAVVFVAFWLGVYALVVYGGLSFIIAFCLMAVIHIVLIYLFFS